MRRAGQTFLPHSLTAKRDSDAKRQTNSAFFLPRTFRRNAFYPASGIARFSPSKFSTDTRGFPAETNSPPEPILTGTNSHRNQFSPEPILTGTNSRQNQFLPKPIPRQNQFPAETNSPPEPILTGTNSRRNQFPPEPIPAGTNSHRNQFSPKLILTETNSRRVQFSLGSRADCAGRSEASREESARRKARFRGKGAWGPNPSEP